MLTTAQRLMPLNLRFKSRAELREAAAKQGAIINPTPAQLKPAPKPQTASRARRKVPARKKSARIVGKLPPAVVVAPPAPESTPATAPAAETTQPATA